MARHRKYTNEQIDLLRKYYPYSNYDELFKVFPGKNKKEIKSIARYYGIKSNNPGHVMDITDKQFGQLKVICLKEIKDNKSYWLCQCSCGNEYVARGELLKNGKIKSCGCLKHKPKVRTNHVGETFGLLKAVERLPNYNNSGRTYYKCICKCGNYKDVLGSNLVRGHTKSCGCAGSQLKEFWASTGHDRDTSKPIFSIYLHRAPNGKVYVGITRQNAERRWQSGKGYITQKLFYRAITKYGWESFTHEILESGLTEAEACEKEQFYIKKYNSNDPQFGYNATQGGDSSTNYVQPIMQYYNGKPVNFFESCVVAANELGVTPSAVNQYSKDDKNYNGYTFTKLPKTRVYDIPDEMYEIRDENHLNVKRIISEQHREKTIKRNKQGVKPICQYKLDGTFVKSYISIAEAKKEYPHLSTTSIKGNGKSKSAYGYMWRYDDGDHSNIAPIEANKKFRKVIQIDPKTNEILFHFDSLADAERATGISTQQISKACRSINKTAGGYIWKYDD